MRFVDGIVLEISGHGAAVMLNEDGVYMGIALRNGGSGVAMIHAWRAEGFALGMAQEKPHLSDFRPQTRDLFVAAGETGFWQGAIRGHDDPSYDSVRRAVQEGENVIIDILYGDHEGAQKAIARFAVSEWPNVEGDRADLVRYWTVEVGDPELGPLANG